MDGNRRMDQIVTPGDVITAESGYMRGHGTFTVGDKLVASVAGVVVQVNRLICVQPLRSRYVPEIGDVVVGRITEVGQKRWKVDLQTRLDAVLLLSSVNLPGGVLRRRDAADELLMRETFVEGDVITAEVQSIFQDGAPSIHTRSLKYGKVRMGTFVSVTAALVKRCKNHFHNLPCGVGVVLGNNGYIWIGKPFEEDNNTPSDRFDQVPSTKPDVVEISRELREKIARVRNIIMVLAKTKLVIFYNSIVYCYEDSVHLPVKEIVAVENEQTVIGRAQAACVTGEW